MPVGAEIILGLLTSIIYDGLKRPLKGFTDISGRRRAINRTLSAAPSVPQTGTQLIAPALQDVQRVIANDHGLYTDNVARFLQDVDRSAIPDALKHLALCGYDPLSAFPAFDLLYKAHEPLPFIALDLFNALNAAIKTRIDQSLIDKTLFESSTAQHEEVKAALNAVLSCLHNALNIQTPLSVAEIESLREKIAKGIESANRTINVETTQGTRKVAINRLVIPARLDYAPEDLEIPKPHRDAYLDRSTSITYLNFRKTFSRSVILGDPGGGKSTLTQQLCYDLAHQTVLSISNPGYKGFDSRDMKIPLRVVLRTLDKRRQKDPSYQIFDYIVDDLRVYCDNDPVVATRFLRQTLSLGQAVLLFDGLDEILDIGSRREMSSMIETFSTTYAACSALVTSRIVGYTDASLNSDFQIFTLSRFNKEEIQRFAERLIRAISGISAAEAKVKANNFISQTNTTAEDLRENPLLLGLMVYIFYSRGEVPNNRPEIYKECSILMFEKWDQRRDIRFDFPHDFDLLDLFGFLAAQIFGSAETEDGVPESWLMSRVKSYFEGWYQDKIRAYGAAKVLVEFITGRAWVMCEIGPGIYKFTHRTFLEYFFAKRIEEEAGSIDGLIQGTLAGKVTSAEWDVVSHLALQIATFRSGPKSSQAIESLLKLGGESAFSPEEEINFLTFFSRSLSYLLVPESVFIESVEYIVRRCVDVGSALGLEAMGVVYILIETAKSKARDIKGSILGIFDPILNAGPSRKRSYLLYFMAARYFVFRSSRGALVDDGVVWAYFEETRRRVESDQYECARSSLDAARDYIFVYNKNIVEMYSLYGVSLLFCQCSKTLPWDVSGLGYRLVNDSICAISGIYGYGSLDSALDKGEASSFLWKLTDDMYSYWELDNLQVVIACNRDDDTDKASADHLLSFTRYIMLKRRSAKIRNDVARILFFVVVVRGDQLFREGAKRPLKLMRSMLSELQASIPEDRFVVALADILRAPLKELEVQE